jgi:hypothetical protein
MAASVSGTLKHPDNGLSVPLCASRGRDTTRSWLHCHLPRRSTALQSESADQQVGLQQIRLISLSNCGEAKSRAFDLAFLLSRLGLLRYCKRLLDKTANCFRTGQLSILAPHPSIQSGKLGRL